MVLRLQGISITINVRTMSGKTLTFEVQPTATARSVKETVQELVKLPAESHTLNFTSMIPDEGSLAEWGVSHSSTLRLIAIPERPASNRPGSPGSSAGSSSGHCEVGISIAPMRATTCAPRGRQAP